jgi:hypothetical protein
VIRGEYRVLSSAKVYEAYKVGKRGGGITLSFASPEKDFLEYIYGTDL